MNNQVGKFEELATAAAKEAALNWDTLMAEDPVVPPRDPPAITAASSSASASGWVGHPRPMQQATLATVAPGIAEALIATAIGLFAAIPAVIAYNRFSARGEMLIGRYYTFADEFQAILHRKVHTTED